MCRLASSTQMLTFRPMATTDAAQVLTINASSHPHVAGLSRFELARLLSLSNAHIVAVDGQTVLGYALSFARDDAYDGEEFIALRSLIAEPFLYIDQVATAGSMRRAGIGRRLYGSLEHAALLRGARSLCCEVNTTPPNPDSLAFHTRLGFSKLAAFATGDGRRVDLLQKRL